MNEKMKNSINIKYFSIQKINNYSQTIKKLKTKLMM